MKSSALSNHKTITRQYVVNFFQKHGKEATEERFKHNQAFMKKALSGVSLKKKPTAKLIVEKKTITPEGIPLATKVKVVKLKNTDSSEVKLGKGGKPRGRFDHPDGLKKGDLVELDMKGKKVQGVFQYCQRNSMEYGVMLVDGKYAERGLSRFKKVEVPRPEKVISKVTSKKISKKP